MINRCSPGPRFCILTITFFALSAFAMAVRIPAHIFPDEKSDVITYIKVSESELEQYSKVLDPGLRQTWYWTTHRDKFTGYVNKKDIDGKNRLKKGTTIRMDPTYSSWSLTKYEPDDKIRIRSRLSVGRISITKEIPLYFQFKKPEETKIEKAVAEAPRPETAALSQPAQPIVMEEVVGMQPIETQPVEQPQTLPPQVETPVVIESEGAETGMKAEQPATEQTTPEVQEIQETPVIQDEPKTTRYTFIDPILEEASRISPQELVNLAPPPMDLFQEFEGYLKLVQQDDPQGDVFKYQLETRSGRRIVYVDTAQLMNESFIDYVNMWINIRGTLEETQPDLALYIEARSIWVAP
jgi:hypothetical protein